MNVSFYFRTDLQTIMDSPMGAEAKIELNEEEAKLLQTAFGDRERVDAEEVKNAVGDPLWQRLRKVMAEAIYVEIVREAHGELYESYEMEWNESHDTLWKDLSEEERLAYVSESVDSNIEPGLRIDDMANLNID